ncbi:capsid protein [Blackbird associated gemycircularvirus 1]|uniref:Capsid protein n=1 Tax=Blackbird associated gemycircularvirus 1 TaxID=1985371 RepID=T1YRZ0_9VIRU|nr:capsid protein [Blackbird associated gemycircularvirus 1]AGU67672.1 capsid protein [Blackbird associated gemycircularvirus 1]
MVYRRKSSSSRARKPIGRTGRRGGTRRRYPTRKRTYRKNRALPKKRILNLTSRKKRNGMLTWTNTSSENGGSVTPGIGSLVVNARDGLEMIFCPHRHGSVFSSGTSTVAQVPLRTATSCYMRGFAENIRIQSSSGIPWFHRRICFTHKGDAPFRELAAGDTPVNTFSPLVETSNGMQRLAFNLTINAQANTRNAMKNYLFKGAQGRDWNNLIVAPVDTSRVTLKFDKTWTYRSGNANGMVKETKLFHPMNQTLVYDDDENGDIEQDSYYSVASKAGMGDYYVMDFIQPGLGGSVTDLLAMHFNSTMYWHER